MADFEEIGNILIGLLILFLLAPVVQQLAATLDTGFADTLLQIYGIAFVMFVVMLVLAVGGIVADKV